MPAPPANRNSETAFRHASERKDSGAHGVGVDVAPRVGYNNFAAGREQGAARPRQRRHGRRRVGDVGAEDQGEAVVGVGEDATYILRIAPAQPLDRDLAPAVPP